MNQHWRKEVVTVAEAAPMLHVSVRTVYRMIHAGILKPAPTALGTGIGVTVIPRSEIEAYIEKLTSSARRLSHSA